MKARNLSCYAAFLLSAALYAPLAASFFPQPPGHLGSDYSYFLPLVLADKYWIATNGWFALPQFTPAFCGGFLILGNPRSIFYSVPQVLAAFVNPENSFLVTTVLFAWLGGLGTFLLMRRRFGAAIPASCLGAVVFLFNGFLLYRMAIGHVTYHAVGLVPLLCYILLTPLGERPDRLARAAVAMAGAGAILAYFVYAGTLDLIVPLTAAVLAIWLLHALVRAPVASFWPVGAGTAVIGGMAAAAKLVPVVVLLRHFPRPDGLEIFADLHAVIGVLFRGLFLPERLSAFVLRPEMTLAVGRHELEFGIGLVPPLLILTGICVGIARGALRRRIAPGKLVTLIAFVLLMAFPIWVNYGSLEFVARLRSLPYFGQSVLLVRWFYIYLLVLSVGAGLMLDYLVADGGARAAVAVAGMAGVVLPALLADHSYYHAQPYDPAEVLAADQRLSETGAPPPILRVETGPANRDNDGLAAGESSAQCYEPVFGYYRQSFPPGLTTGALSEPGHHLRNPACYVYGAANGCAPGDSFSPDQAKAEAAFAAYRPFPYRRPWWQLAAETASVLGLAAIMLGFALGLHRFARQRLASRRGDPARQGALS